MELYDQDSLMSLVWGCQHILILALDFFQRSGHHMVPISCKASLQRDQRDWLILLVILVYYPYTDVTQPELLTSISISHQ